MRNMKPFCITLVVLIAVFQIQNVHSSSYDESEYQNPAKILLPKVSNVTVVRRLIEKLFKSHSENILIKIDRSIGPDDKDTFVIDSENDKVSLTGTSPIALAMSVQYYMKYFCKMHVSWSGTQLNIVTLPLPTKPVKITANDNFRYYQNVCTVSYSMVWWNWERWETEIDWMALNGINLPLAFTAQEAIWYRVYKSVGFSDGDIDDFFTGPAFLAWNRMGNFQAFAGPLSQSWHKKRIELQHKILDRMKEYGMVPVLPAFGGRVPPAFSRLFPGSMVVNVTGGWGGFKKPYCCTSFLEPQDPLFLTMGSLFLQEYIKEFGTSHIYNTDLFNEMPSPSSDPAYLAKCGKAVFSSLTMVDPDAIWLMQGWIFVNDPSLWQPPQTKALLTSVPRGKMIILDLEAEFFPQYQRFESYYGQPFIWCMLHNFGGVLGMYGAIDAVNQGSFVARNFTNSTMIGTGLTPEGIEKNDVMFEFMNEMAWRKEPVADIDEWLQFYATCRYGKNDTNVNEAWKYLRRSVYNATSSVINHGVYILTSRPSLKRTPLTWYDTQDVANALTNFQIAAKDKSLQTQGTFVYDLIDVARQVLQISFAAQHVRMKEAFQGKDLDSFETISKSMMSMLTSLDTILSLDDHYKLDAWISSAKKWASTPQEEIQFEYNARNQITLWGPTGEILDYAAKQWSGVVSGYYQPRWELFFNTLTNTLTRGTPFNQNNFNQKVLWFVEEPFTYKRETSLTSNDIEQNVVETINSVLNKHHFEIKLLTTDKELFRKKPEVRKMKNRKKKLRQTSGDEIRMEN